MTNKNAPADRTFLPQPPPFVATIPLSDAAAFSKLVGPMHVRGRLGPTVGKT
jgi:hypothetical protein